MRLGCECCRNGQGSAELGGVGLAPLKVQLSDGNISIQREGHFAIHSLL